jgi:hypothetical protein
MSEEEKSVKTPEVLPPNNKVEAGSAQTPAPPEAADVKPDEQAPAPMPPSVDYSGVVGAIFWVIVFGALGFWWFVPHNRAQVFLEASPKQPLHISGVVLFKGTPVSKGTVYVVFDHPKNKLYLGGAILPVAESGAFTTSGHELGVSLDSHEESQEPLRIAATFSGQQQSEKKDKAATTIAGKATLYLNYPPPIGKWTTWSFIIIAAGMAILLITLFTGDLTRRKARMLFSITYIMTFMSLAVPIGAIVMVSKSQYAVEMMEQAPVGLIKGTARGVQHPQWLVNLGGAVVPSRSEGQPPMKAPVSASPSPVPQSSPALQPSPTPQENMAADELRQTPGFAMVRGGLAVPFYVIILAMLGAGINMTKKVPDIQKRHDIQALPLDTESIVSAALRAPMAAFAPSETRVDTRKGATAVSGIRKDLIDTYMGIISAPFLAIAVYYLLQIIATNIAEPVLVLVSFATGFISDSIVTAITTFASEMISKRRQEKLGEENVGEPQNELTKSSENE